AVTFSSAPADLADIGISWYGRDGPDGSTAGASSRTTCALVPPTPNELTPARRGTPSRSHTRCMWLTKNGLDWKSICGFGVLKWRVAGMMPRSIDRTVLIRP